MKVTCLRRSAAVFGAWVILALVPGAGCDKAPAKPEAEAPHWQERYEKLVDEYEADVKSKLGEIEELKAKNEQLAGEVGELSRKLEAARSRAARPEAAEVEKRLNDKDERIRTLQAEVDRLQAKLASMQAGVAPEAAGPEVPAAQGGPIALAREQLVGLGEQMIKADLAGAAATVLEEAVRLGAEGPQVLFELGNLYGDLGDNEGAAQWYERAAGAVGKDPTTPARLAAKIYNNYGATLVALGKPEEALPWYEKAVATDESYAAVHFNLGLLYASHLNDTDKAIESYRRHVELGGGRGITARNAILKLQEGDEADGKSEIPKAEKP